MLPGFVTLFKDKNHKVHLFFFPGLDEESNSIFRTLDLSKTGVEYEKIKFEDGAEEFIFDREDILKITCKLVDRSGSISNVELNLD